MNLAEQLEAFEGRRGSAYFDTEGFATIGVGRLIDSRKGGGLSDDEIDLLLANDIREKTAQVMAACPWAEKLNAPRQAVLIGMCFQLGIGGLMNFAHTLMLTRNGQYTLAGEAMLDSKWAKQTPARAKRMAEQMRTGAWA